MKSRFYGSKRTVYSKYRICPKDYILIAFELILTAVIIALKLCGYMKFTFEPVISMGELKIYAMRNASIVLANVINDRINPLAAFLIIIIKQMKATKISIARLIVIFLPLS